MCGKCCCGPRVERVDDERQIDLEEALAAERFGEELIEALKEVVAHEEAPKPNKWGFVTHVGRLYGAHRDIERSEGND